MCLGGPAHQVYFIALHIVFADPAYAVYIAHKTEAAEKQNEPDVDQPIRPSDLSFAF
nr:hypothetical protein [uncultured Campylobacter sp.]